MSSPFGDLAGGEHSTVADFCISKIAIDAAP